MTRDAIIVRSNLARDPILDMGKNPVDCEIADGSEQHDRYLVMKEHGSESALSFDKHFTQAGFKTIP